MSPVRPENRRRYPTNWRAIRRGILLACGWRCECMGECGSDPCKTLRENNGPMRCPETLHGSKAAFMRGNVVLTIAHLDHMPENCQRANLKAMCQRCHLVYDQEHHAETRLRNSAP